MPPMRCRYSYSYNKCRQHRSGTVGSPSPTSQPTCPFYYGKFSLNPPIEPIRPLICSCCMETNSDDGDRTVEPIVSLSIFPFARFFPCNQTLASLPFDGHNVTPSVPVRPTLWHTISVAYREPSACNRMRSVRTSSMN